MSRELANTLTAAAWRSCKCFTILIRGPWEVRSTLFFIPHEFAGVPVFGFGWLLGCLVLAATIWIAWSLARKQSILELLSALPVWLVAAAIVAFVLPQVEVVLPDGQVAGLPIRGYGVLVLGGLLAGIAITIYRGKQLGILPDTIVGLGFWMMLGGIIGARLFYVVQKWEDYDQLSLGQRLIDIVKLTEGGLVIYGGVVGGLVAGGIYCWRHRLNIPSTADLIAPGFLLGYSIGRIGCLLHGCCFGGSCMVALPTIEFPAGSVPYNSQLASGELLGIELRGTHQPPGEVAHVRAGSLAEKAEITAGQRIEDLAWGVAGAPRHPAEPPPVRADVLVEGRRIAFDSDQLPPRSLPTHPSQIYASIDALLLCLLIWCIQPLPRRDGVTFLTAVALYAVSRFLLEGIRSDEAGQLGTPFTIAQLLALASGALVPVLLWAAWQRPPKRAWAWPSGQ